MSSDPMVGQDEGTQKMVQEAQQNFPDKSFDEAVQRQADMGPRREASKGEGGGIVESMKGAAESAVEKVKDLNPATRDMKDPHC